MTTASSIKAVIFDLGGVLVGNPLSRISQFERAHNLPQSFINNLIRTTGENGSFARLERGQLTLEQFYPCFEAESRAAGHTIRAKDLMADLFPLFEVNEAMLKAAKAAKAEGLKVGILSNTWHGVVIPKEISGIADVVVESAKVGMAKPSQDIYHHTLNLLGVKLIIAIFFFY
jgi:epoxide hydrolase-like predicted phosphatase